MVLDKAREEAYWLHTETPGNRVRAAARVAVPTVDRSEQIKTYAGAMSQENKQSALMVTGGFV